MRSAVLKRTTVLAVVAWGALISAPAWAADRTWDGGGADNNWSTAANWNGDTPLVANDALFFGRSGGFVNNLSANRDYTGITFNSSLRSDQVISGNEIDLFGDIVNINPGRADASLDLPIELSGGVRTINAQRGGITFGGVISGTHGFIKTGVDLVTMEGNNTFTGAVRIEQGWLRFSGSNAFTQELIVTGSTAQVLAATGSLQSVPLVLDNGRFNYSNSGTASRSQTLSSLRLTGGSSLVDVSSGSSNPSTTLTINSWSRENGATVDFDVTGTAARIMLPGQPTGFIGASAIANTTGFAVRDSGGFVRPLAYGSDANSVSVTSGTTLGANSGRHVQFTGATITNQPSLNIRTLRVNTNVMGLASGATLTLSEGGVFVSDSFQISGGAGIAASSARELIVHSPFADVTIGTPILSSWTEGLTLSGNGTTYLLANNLYSGGTRVHDGRLVVRGSLGSGDLFLSWANVDFELAANGVFRDSIVGTGSSFLVQNGPGALTLTGATASGVRLWVESGQINLSGIAVNTPHVNVYDRLRISGSAGSISADSFSVGDASTVKFVADPNGVDKVYLPETAPSLGNTGDSLVVDLGAYLGTAPVTLFDYVGTVGATPFSTVTFLNGTGTLASDVSVSGRRQIRVTGFTLREWDGPSGGSWLTDANWTVGADPSGIDAVALFRTAAPGAGTVNLNGARTVRYVRFDNDNPYTLTGANTLTLQHEFDSAAIDVFRGSHQIATPVSLASNLDVSVAAGSALAISGAVSGAGRTLQKLGDGLLSLSGANTYSGNTSVAAGELRVLGSLASPQVQVAAGAILSGTGTVNSITGAGLVSPGLSPGVLTGDHVDFSGGLDFAFEFTATGSPNYGNATASINDVLRLTDSDPFLGSATSANVFDLYLNVSELTGASYRGGFFTDTATDQFADLQNATVQYWIRGDGLGTDATFNGQDYYALSNFYPEAILALSMTTEAANFGSGLVNGRVMLIDVVHVPEPSSVLLALLAGGLGYVAYRRRSRLTSWAEAHATN